MYPGERFVCTSCGHDFEILVGDSSIGHVQIVVRSQRIAETPFSSLQISLIKCSKCNKDVAINWEGSWKSIREAVCSVDKDKSGLLQVQSTEDRVVLYILSQIFYNQYERGEDEVLFSFPSLHDISSILWQRGKAVAFFTIKPQGQLYAEGISEVYHLPVVDLVYVMHDARRCGHALTVLDEVVCRYPNQDVGFSSPLSEAMWAVLRKYLSTHKKERRYFWATTFTGGEGDQTNVWLTLRHRDRQAAKQTAEQSH